MEPTKHQLYLPYGFPLISRFPSLRKFFVRSGIQSEIIWHCASRSQRIPGIAKRRERDHVERKFIMGFQIWGLRVFFWWIGLSGRVGILGILRIERKKARKDTYVYFWFGSPLYHGESHFICSSYFFLLRFLNKTLGWIFFSRCIFRRSCRKCCIYSVLGFYARWKSPFSTSSDEWCNYKERR